MPGYTDTIVSTLWILNMHCFLQLRGKPRSSRVSLSFHVWSLLIPLPLYFEFNSVNLELSEHRFCRAVQLLSSLGGIAHIMDTLDKTDSQEKEIGREQCEVSLFSSVLPILTLQTAYFWKHSHLIFLTI